MINLRHNLNLLCKAEATAYDFDPMLGIKVMKFYLNHFFVNVTDDQFAHEVNSTLSIYQIQDHQLNDLMNVYAEINEAVKRYLQYVKNTTVC